MAIETLNWMEFPESSGIMRGVLVPPECRSAGFDDEYDLRTFIYDAFFVPKKQTICIICPKLHQFDTVIKHGKFTANGQQLKPRVKLRKGNSGEIWLPCDTPPESLRIQTGSFDHETPVGIQDNETFRGLWCAVLKSKDNDLVWIKDWVNYHVKVHGLNGLVFFDNGSEQYSLEELHSALISISGLKKVRVLSAPFLWGASIDRFISSSRMVYWHCRKITTHWKSQRGVPPTNQLTVNREAKQVIYRVF
jgi:hypothetical protein